MRAYPVVLAFGFLLIALLGLQFLAASTTVSTIGADIDIVPQVFNIGREDEPAGNITAFVSNLTKDGVSYNVRDINVSTIGIYYKGDLISKALRAIIANDKLIVRFDALTVANYIWTNIAYHMGTIPPQANKTITLTVSGQLNSGEQFAGNDAIKIISP